MKFATTRSHEAKSLELDSQARTGQKTYQSPELVEVASAKKLLRGPTYTQTYRDCGQSGTTRYNC